MTVMEENVKNLQHAKDELTVIFRSLHKESFSSGVEFWSMGNCTNDLCMRGNSILEDLNILIGEWQLKVKEE